MEGTVFGSSFDRGFEVRAGAHTADEHLVVPDATDHVHVEHGNCLLEQTSKILDPFGRAEEAEFFSGEVGEENAAIELSRKRREEASQLENACGTRGIVVGP